ncbi:MAG: efflux RND transporter periplasmic adaptor subunit [Terrimicrobiaceae bacterium]|nr:efflux RND transporter periplasmic adaptor subunit [Terrimicrobiaceae bacterium]
MNKITYPLLALFALAFVTGCEKPAPEETAASEGAHEEKIVTLTKQNLEHVEIKTSQVSLGSLETTLKAAGRVSENMNKTAKVASTLEGRLVKLNFDINDRVKAGDVLALVQTPELLGKPLELKAPIDGLIVARNSTVGELVDKGSDIYTISDPADLWVIAEVKERDIAAVKVGQDATFKVLPYPEAEFHGKVVRLGNQLESDSRTLEVRIETSNADGRLKPGMFADVEITTTVLKDVLVIPDTSLQSDGEAQVVFVAFGDGKFEKRTVTLGMEHRGRVQILDGIKAGETVVTQGSFILKSELLKGELGEE